MALVMYQAWATIGSGRLKGRYFGDVIKENHHTVWMIFYPPGDLKRKLMEQGITAQPVGPVKRHKRKHNVSRIAGVSRLRRR